MVIATSHTTMHGSMNVKLELSEDFLGIRRDRQILIYFLVFCSVVANHVVISTL